MGRVCAGFNRYIVECKFFYGNASPVPTGGFNRYIVECKYKMGTSMEMIQNGFNRYIVECKSVRPRCAAKSVCPDLIDT